MLRAVVYSEHMNDLDCIWNRALDYDLAVTAPGDRALRDVLTFDGTASNGGLLNAVESFSGDPEFPVERVIEAFHYFSMERTAMLVSSCAAPRRSAEDRELESLEIEFDPQYPVAGEDISAALEVKLMAAPQAFQPRG